jgi:predicted alpha/beta hydrolase
LEVLVKLIGIRGEGAAAIAARVFEPPAPARASVVIGGAMGVRQAFYAPFAQWLSTQGFRVTTFDYRGSGDSLPIGSSLRAVKADLSDWARDYEAVIDHAAAAAPALPVYLLGHSLGAQLPGLLRNRDKVAGLLGVATGSGYWRDNAPKLKRVALWFWYAIVPPATRLFGYFPGRRLRKIGDLPAGVMLQWRRWCLDPLYSFGAEGNAAKASYHAVRFPVLALSITDDEMMTLRGTQTLVDFYANAPRAVERIAPGDVQARRIGHFGLFREQFAASLWPRVVDSLGALAALRVADRTA